MAIGIPNLLMGPDSANRNSGSASGATSSDGPIGSLIVVCISAKSSGTISTLTDSGGNSYSLAVAVSATGGGTTDIELWYSLNTTHDLPSGGTFTATTSGGGQYFVNGAASISGCNGGLDNTNTAKPGAVSSFSLTVPSSGSLSVPNEIVMVCFIPSGSAIAGTYTEGAGFTELTGSPVSNNSGCDFAYNIVSSIAAVTWSPSWTVNSPNISAAVATFEITSVPPSPPAIGVLGLAACEY